MIRQPPRSTLTDTLFPSTALFRAGGGQQMRGRLHILILARGADTRLAQFSALRFEPLHPLGGAGKCAEPVETLAVGGLEIIIVDRFQERPAIDRKSTRLNSSH